MNRIVVSVSYYYNVNLTTLISVLVGAYGHIIYFTEALDKFIMFQSYYRLVITLLAAINLASVHQLVMCSKSVLFYLSVMMF